MDDPFKYKHFEYKTDEWDNVPGVIPRFTFYLQTCLDECIKFSNEVHERQSTQDLKVEMYENFDKHNKQLKDEEKARVDDIKSATARKDSLQKQIDDMNNKGDTKEKDDYSKGQEDLLEEYLHISKNFS